jgi:hypothetical protein
MISSDVPHEYALSVVGGLNTRFFDGKLVLGERGASTRIESVEFGVPMKLRVESTDGFRVGEKLYYYDVRRGDRVVIPTAWQGRLE